MDKEICHRQCSCLRYCGDFKEIFSKLLEDDGIHLIQWIAKILQQRKLSSFCDAADIINVVYCRAIDQMATGDIVIPDLAWDDSQTLGAWVRKAAFDIIVQLDC